MNFTTWIIAFVFVLIFHSTFAQSRIGFSAGGNYTQVVYKNSSGERYNSLKGLPGFGVGAILESGVGSKQSRFLSALQLKLGYKSSQFKDGQSNLLNTWSINSVSASTGFVLSRNARKTLNEFYGIEVIHDFMVSGIQNRGFIQYDLSDALKKYNMSVALTSGLNYTISDFSHCSLWISYSRGLSNLERDVNQTARFHAWMLSAAVYFSLHKSK